MIPLEMKMNIYFFFFKKKEAEKKKWKQILKEKSFHFKIYLKQ